MNSAADVTTTALNLTTAERRARVDCRSLTDAELLAAVTGLTVREAKSVLHHAQCLKGLVQSALPARAELKLQAAYELARRTESQPDPRPALTTPDAIASFMQRKLKHLAHEEFWVLSLNSRNVLLRADRAAKGSVTSCAVDPRDVFAPAILCKASAIVVSHNHPSGDPTPSFADLELTRQLVKAGSALCIKLLDHVIVGDGRWHSMAARGEA